MGVRGDSKTVEPRIVVRVSAGIWVGVFFLCCALFPISVSELLKAVADIHHVEFKNWMDKRAPFFLGWHNRKIYSIPKRDHSPLYDSEPK